MKTLEAMSLKELMSHRAEVWKDYSVSLGDKNKTQIREKATELDAVDRLLRVRIYG